MAKPSVAGTDTPRGKSRPSKGALAAALLVGAQGATGARAGQEEIWHLPGTASPTVSATQSRPRENLLGQQLGQQCWFLLASVWATSAKRRNRAVRALRGNAREEGERLHLRVFNINTWRNLPILPFADARVWVLQETRHARSAVISQRKWLRKAGLDGSWGTCRPPRAGDHLGLHGRC